MKKAFLLVLLLSSVILAQNFTFSGIQDPSTVGEPYNITITADEGTGEVNLRLVVDGDPQEFVVPSTADFGGGTEITISLEFTYAATDVMLRCVDPNDGDIGDSDPFDIDPGPAAKWRIVGPGDEAKPGTSLGKDDDASVTAGDPGTYDIQVCDEWNNVVDAGGNTPTISSSTDDFAQLPASPAIGNNTIELRTVEGTSGSQVHTVTVSGGSLESDDAHVTVNVGTATKLLILCADETQVPGDTSTTPKASPVSYPGKTGQCADANTSAAYQVDVYAVDKCWNIVPTYDAIEVNVFGNSEGDLTGATTDAISNGIASDVPAEFGSPHSQGEYISANDGSITTANDTKVIVAGGVDSVYLSLSANPVPPGVHSTLTIEAFAGGVPAGVVDITLTADAGVQILNGIWELETNTSGVAITEVWADQEGLYEITGCSGAACDDIDLNVSAVQGLIAAPNPFKYSTENQSINFIYDVPEGGADEVMLLIVDPYGNIVYRATYTEGDPISSGQQSVTWNVMNSNDIRVASGMYQAVLRVKSGLSTTTNTKNIMVIW